MFKTKFLKIGWFNPKLPEFLIGAKIFLMLLKNKFRYYFF